MIDIRRTLLVAFLLQVVMVCAEISQQCLYCRRKDFNSGFLTTYSYCNQTDECVQDVWSYVNRRCTSKWKKGEDVLLNDCEPKVITCQDFASKPEYAGSY